VLAADVLTIDEDARSAFNASPTPSITASRNVLPFCRMAIPPSAGKDVDDG
jgi:hypothetical protein